MATPKQRRTATSLRILAGDNTNDGRETFLIAINPQLLLPHLLFSSEVKVFYINRNFLNRSGKLIVPFLIIIRHRCFIIHPYVNTLVTRIKERFRFRDFPFSDFLPIDIQNGLPAGPRLATVKNKLVLYSMFTGNNGFGRSNVSVFKPEEIVLMMKPTRF